MGETRGPGQARPRVRVLLAVAVTVLALDIVSKQIVVAKLAGGSQVRLLGGLVTLLETRNPGAAFSLGGSSETILFSAIAVGVAVYIVRAARRIYSIAWAVALGLLLGGACGNLTDRIFRAPGLFRGWVVDWIQLPHWPVFNLADSAISCGGVLMVLLAVLGRGIEGKQRPAAATAASPVGSADKPQEPSPGSADTGSQPEEPTLEPPSSSHQPVTGQAEMESAEALQAAAEEPVPEPAAGSAGPATAPEPSVPEPTAAEEPVAGQAQPEWPEPEQPQSQWPRSEWPDPDETRQEHPARGSGG